MKLSTQLIALTTVLTFGLFAGSAMAQSQGQQGQQPPNQASAEDVSDADLEQYVDAESEIQSIRQEYVETINNAESQEEAQSLQVEAQEKMVSAVEGAGLSIEEYNQIANALQSNEELRKKAEQMR